MSGFACISSSMVMPNFWAMPYIVSFFFTLYKSCHFGVCAATDDASSMAQNKKRILMLRLISIILLKLTLQKYTKYIVCKNLCS